MHFVVRNNLTALCCRYAGIYLLFQPLVIAKKIINGFLHEIVLIASHLKREFVQPGFGFGRDAQSHVEKSSALEH